MLNHSFHQHAPCSACGDLDGCHLWRDARVPNVPRRKFHKNAPDIPTDPAERKARIRWLYEHPLWTFPTTVLRPPDWEQHPDPMSMFDENGIREPGPDWEPWETALGGLHECIEIQYVFVNPATIEVDDDDSRNTMGYVWIEGGGWADMSENPHVPVPDGGWDDHNKWTPVHDTSLDCGGPDLETALLELAARVDFFYGDGKEYRPELQPQCEGTLLPNDEYKSGCTSGSTGFCLNCGFIVGG